MLTTRRPLILSSALAAAAAAGAVVAAGSSESAPGHARMSNRGTPVRLAASGTPASLLAQRARRTFFSFRNALGEECVAIGRMTSEGGKIGSAVCAGPGADATFPFAPGRSLLVLPAVEILKSSPQRRAARLLSLVGFAADGVHSVEFASFAGSVVSRARVSGNVFLLHGVAGRPLRNGAVIARDATGAEVERVEY